MAPSDPPPPQALLVADLALCHGSGVELLLAGVEVNVVLKNLLSAPGALVAGLLVASCGEVRGLTQDTDGGGGPATHDGLPCDVANLLQSKCDSCHGSPLAGGAPMKLISRAELIAPSATAPSKSNAQLSVERMQSTTSPMPPGGGATSAEIATLQAWLNGGTPAGTCLAQTPDAGIPDTPPQCTSNAYWTFGDSGSSRMHPGMACIACHSRDFEAPSLTVAGTVYPTVHEPDDCNGTGGAQVVITEANGTAHTLTPNSVGNFYIRTALQFPIRAKVVANGLTREMVTPQMSGDCNSCHSQNGSMDAPGRIILP